MKFSLIAAHSVNRVIGKNNQLPWKMPSDLKRFKELTTGKIIVMGRKTYDSIGKPLPKRINVVVTSNITIADKFTYSQPEMIGITGIAEAIQLCKHLSDYFTDTSMIKEVMVIGGQSIYEAFLPLSEKLYLTEVGINIDNGDAFFPEFNKENWSVTSQTEGVDEMCLLQGITKHISLPYTYKILEKVKQ